MATATLAPTPRSLPVSERLEVLTATLRDLGELAETLAEISRDSRLDREPRANWLDTAETVCYLDRALEAGHRALATFTLSQSAPRGRCPDCDVHVDPFVHQCGRSDRYPA